MLFLLSLMISCRLQGRPDGVIVVVNKMDLWKSADKNGKRVVKNQSELTALWNDRLPRAG
jgi:hypothetical protein